MTDPADTIPGREPASTMYRRIVVGVDGSSPSLGALRHAAELGDLLRVDVVAIRAWGPQTKYMGLSSGPLDMREHALFGLEEAITRAFANRPPERVTGLIREGDPADVLISESDPHDLLVVGSRGHGSVAGIALGSVSARCAERARCSVLVYHAPTAATAS
jgi:nucleotide-binding universal stress UspA family protein